MKKQRIFLLILAAILCLGLLSTGVCAGGDEVFVGNVNVADGGWYVMDSNTGELTKTGGSESHYDVHYDYLTHGLTLNGLRYSGEGHSFYFNGENSCAGIYTNIRINILLIGESRIVLTGTENNYGIFHCHNGSAAGQNMTLLGNKNNDHYETLYITAANDNKSYTGIYNGSSYLSLEDVILNSHTEKCTDNQYGIRCGDLKIEDAVIQIWNGKTGGDSFGIYSGYASLTDGSVSINLKESEYQNHGFHTRGIAVLNSYMGITTEGSKTRESSALYSESSNVNITSSYIYLTAGDAGNGTDNYSTGLFCGDNLSVSASEGSIQSGYSVSESAAIFIDNNCFISNKSNLRLCGGQAKRGSFGIQCYGNYCDISYSTVFARSDEAKDSCGIYNKGGSTTVTESDVIAYAKSGNTSQKAFNNVPIPSYSSGVSVFAGSDSTKAKRVDSFLASNYQQPYAWILSKSKAANKFNDVKENSWYGVPVLWAVAHGITSGTSGNTFSPNVICDRAQMVTFLYNFAQKPETYSYHSVEDTPFKDIQNGKYYTGAVLWAYENGVTEGTTATTFEPKKQLTRAEVVTFLWKYDGKPAPESKKNPFSDLNANWYKDAVLWAAENGITSGKTPTAFAPNDPCSRAEIVSFLFRYEMVR